MINKHYDTEGHRLAYERIVFEVTRRCNLRCAHCFRGEPQNVDISKEIIDKALDQISSSMSFDVTGGEPFLVPELIEYLVDGIIQRKLLFTHFSLVVNGTIMDERAERAVKAINKLAVYLYEDIYPKAWERTGEVFDFEKDTADEKLRIDIAVSVDEFHGNNPDEAVAYYRSFANKYVLVERQDEWINTDDDGNSKTQAEIRDEKVKEHSTWLECEGRAKENHLGYRVNSCDYCNVTCHKVEMDDKNCVQCPVQICANGNVTIGEQISFESVDKFSMGNILEEPLSCIIWKNTFNEPLLCVEVYKLLQCETMLAHKEYKDEEQKKFTELLISMLKMKRDFMREAHERLPYLTYGELLLACDADLNIQSDGMYAQMMSEMFDFYKKKYDGWTYSEEAEQQICNQYLGTNVLRKIGDKAETVLHLLGGKC